MIAKKWFNKFWRYVKSGTYQKFIRDLEETMDSSEIANVNNLIRQTYIDELMKDFTFAELGKLRIDDDSTVLAENYDIIKRVIPTFTRLMVGNHGVYVEFTKPLDRGRYIQKCKQYVWYEKEFMKFYEQTETVNYADYKIGMWYVSIYDVFDIPHPNF